MAETGMHGWQPIETAPRGTVRIALTKGKTTLIDGADLAIVAGRKWQAHERRDGKGWYAVSDGVRMHRLLLGVTDPQAIVDHRDGDGLNNRRDNLRAGTQSQNCVNRKQTPGPYLRGARPKKGRWRASIKYQGKVTSLGYFDTEFQAHTAYLTAARKIHGDWMPLPNPPEASHSFKEVG